MQKDWQKVSEWCKKTEEDTPEEECLSSTGEPDMDTVQETAEKLQEAAEREKSKTRRGPERNAEAHG